MKFTIWHDNDYDFALWVYENSELKNKANVIIRPIPKNNNPKTLLKIIKSKEDCVILPVIKYESPDIIIQKTTEDTNEILLVTEFMTHTPQFHHPSQRFTRIYGASNLKIPCALVIAKNVIKYERDVNQYCKKSYSLSPMTPISFYKTSKVNETPTLLFFWPTNEFHKLDPKRPSAPRNVEDTKNWLKFLDACLERDEKKIKKIQEEHDKKLLKYLKTKSGYNTITSMDKAKPKRDNYAKLLHGPIKVKNQKEFEKISDDKIKDKGYKFAPEGLVSSNSYFRTDPYAGMLSVYEIVFCRNTKGEKQFNLILEAKNVELSKLKKRGTFISTKNHSKDNCPFENFTILENLESEDIEKHIKKGNCPFTSTKQQRIYTQIADLIIFDDGKYVGDEK